MPTTPNGFASYLEGLEEAGIEQIRKLPVPLLRYEEKFHLRRSSGLRLCDWRTGGTEMETSADELSKRGDLCKECFPGAFGKWTTLSDLGTASVIGLAQMIVEIVSDAEKSILRVEKGQRVSSSKLYEQLHHLRRLSEEAARPNYWPGAPQALIDDLVERSSTALGRLQAALKGEAHRKVLLDRVAKAQARVKDPGYRGQEPCTLYLMAYQSDIFQSLTLTPMLASEVVATYHISEEKGVTALILPGSVIQYLERVGVRANDWRLSSFTVHSVPPDPVILEMALGIWEPTTRGRLSNFESAVATAELLRMQ